MKRLSLEAASKSIASTWRRQCPAHAVKVLSDGMMAILLHPFPSWFILIKIDRNSMKSWILAQRWLKLLSLEGGFGRLGQVNMEKAMPSPCHESLFSSNDGHSPASSISFMVQSHEDWPKLNQIVNSSVEVIEAALSGGFGRLG
jgi:hypothetical protein